MKDEYTQKLISETVKPLLSDLEARLVKRFEAVAASANAVSFDGVALEAKVLAAVDARLAARAAASVVPPVAVPEPAHAPAEVAPHA